MITSCCDICSLAVSCLRRPGGTNKKQNKRNPWDIISKWCRFWLHNQFMSWFVCSLESGLWMSCGRRALALCYRTAVGLYGAAKVCWNPSFMLKRWGARFSTTFHPLSRVCVFKVKKLSWKRGALLFALQTGLVNERSASQISQCPPAWLPHSVVEWQVVRWSDCRVKVCSMRTHIMKWAPLLSAHHVQQLKCLGKTTLLGDRPSKLISAPGFALQSHSTELLKKLSPLVSVWV